MPRVREYECVMQVRSYELDSFGHVNHAVYLNYMEAARGDYLRQAGLSFESFHEWEAFPVVRRAELNFYIPLVVNDEFTVTGIMEPLRRTGFRARQRICRTIDRALVMEAILELVFIDRSGRPIASPPVFRDYFLKPVEEAGG